MNQGINADTPVDMFRFMDLPREIRDMIYVHALVTGQVMYTKVFKDHIRVDHMLSTIPARLLLSIPLLNVCRTINAEATPIFYGKNTFALPEIESRSSSPFTKPATLIRRIVVNLPSAGFHTCWRYGLNWKIQPLLDAWRVSLRNLASFTNLDVVEFDVNELCDAAFYIDYMEGYEESLHGRSSENGSTTALKYLAGQILPDLSAALASSRGEREQWNRPKLRVTSSIEWQQTAICKKWEELGAEHVKNSPMEDSLAAKGIL